MQDGVNTCQGACGFHEVPDFGEEGKRQQVQVYMGFFNNQGP